MTILRMPLNQVKSGHESAVNVRLVPTDQELVLQSGMQLAVEVT